MKKHPRAVADVGETTHTFPMGILLPKKIPDELLKDSEEGCTVDQCAAIWRGNTGVRCGV